jgi:hypothetical protein
MMCRTWLPLMLLAALAGCEAKPLALKTELSVVPGSEPGTYAVEARVVDMATGTPICSPKLIVKEGQRGQMNLNDKETRTVVTALVERPKGHEETKVDATVTIEKKNVDVWSGSQTILIKP